MKRITSLALALALTAALFTGCGCSNVSTHPGGMITEESTRPTVVPTPTATHETTRPTETTHATMPTVTGSDPTGENTMPNGGIDGNSQNGGTGNSTGATGSNGTTGGAGNSESSAPTDATNNARSRGRMPNR